MAEQATVTSGNEPAPTAELAPMSAREADDAINALFSSPPEDPVEAENGNPADNVDEPASTDPLEDTEEQADDPLAVDAETDPENPEDDASEEYANGRFAADNAKVKMPDGRTISVAELKEFADNRVKDFQRDYSRKTEELSKQSQDFETQVQEFSQLQERHGKEREFFKWFTQAYVPQVPQRPTVDASLDPVAWSVYAQQKTSYDEMVNAWQQANSENEEGRKAETEKTQRQRQAELSKEKERFLGTFPALKDPAKYEAFWGALSTEAEKFYGIPKERVLALDNTDMVRILRDAVSYQKVKNSSEQVKKDVNSKPPLVRGSARQSPEQQRNRAYNDRVSKLRQSGSTADADAVLLSFIK